MSLQDEIDAVQARVRQKKVEAFEAEQFAKKELAALRERIAQGETTGNRIQDFAIRIAGNSGFEPVQRLVKALQPLEDSLKGMIGQYAVMIEREHYHANATGCVRRSGSTEETVIVGVIAAEEMLFASTGFDFGIPTSETALRMNDGKLMMRATSRLKPKDTICTAWLAKTAGINTTDGHCDLDFIIGDERVAKWIERSPKLPVELSRLYGDFAKITKLLGRPLETVSMFAEKIQKEREGCLNELRVNVNLRNRHRRNMELPEKSRDYSATEDNLKSLQNRVKDLLSLCERAKLLGIDDDPLVTQILEEYAPATKVASKTATAP